MDYVVFAKMVLIASLALLTVSTAESIWIISFLRKNRGLGKTIRAIETLMWNVLFVASILMLITVSALMQGPEAPEGGIGSATYVSYALWGILVVGKLLVVERVRRIVM